MLFGALIAPPLSAALLSFQQMRSSAPLHHLYHSVAGRLERHELALSRLCQIQSNDENASLPKRFSALVLEVETELMYELLSWQAINQRAELEISA